MHGGARGPSLRSTMLSLILAIVVPEIHASESPVDWLSFMRGAQPVRISPTASDHGVKRDTAFALIDGLETRFTLAENVPGGTSIEIVFALPAPTSFSGFAFGGEGAGASVLASLQRVEIAGSVSGPEGPWQPLAWTDPTLAGVFDFSFPEPEVAETEVVEAELAEAEVAEPEVAIESPDESPVGSPTESAIESEEGSLVGLEGPEGRKDTEAAAEATVAAGVDTRGIEAEPVPQAADAEAVEPLPEAGPAGEGIPVELEDGEILWLKLALVVAGDETAASTVEMTELIGRGSQRSTEPGPVSGSWQMSGVQLTMSSSGATLSGCYGSRPLTGTLDGRVVRAIATDEVSGAADLFLMVASRSGLQGVRSSLGGPFRWVHGEPVDRGGVECEPPPPIACDVPLLGVDLDSHGVLEERWRGLQSSLLAFLQQDPRLHARVVAHVSGEGSDEDSLARSERLARAVVEGLLAAGMAAERLEAVGMGEAQPLASNRQVYGRTLNQRIVLECRRQTGW